MKINNEQTQIKKQPIRKELEVHCEQGNNYYITLNNDFSSFPTDFMRAIGDGSSKKVAVVSDTNVAPLYLEQVKELLAPQVACVVSFVFPAGEQSKQLDTVQQLYEFLVEQQFDRHDLLVALGGGVVGDLTGFAAATYLRGIDFIQVPTSLLAQVDSSIGGKTGVDLNQFKNMVGAFYQPRLVYMSMTVFDTLPEQQFANGMAEELKHGLIKDAAYYTWICEHRTDVQNHAPKIMAKLLETGCNIKRVVVEQDPTEKGERALLNFGHTIGHAIEKLSDFQMYHGECVSVGMVAAAYLSAKKGHLTFEQLAYLEQTLKTYLLPVHVPRFKFDAQQILAATKSDKKMIGGNIKFILLRAIGEAYSDLSLTDDDLLDAIDYILE